LQYHPLLVTEHIKVRYSYRLEDVEDVCDAVDKLNPSIRRARRQAIFAGCLLLAAPFLAARSILHPELFLLLMAPFGLCFLWCGVASPKRDARQRYSQAIDVWPEVDVFIGDDGILMHTRSVPGELVTWESISQGVEGKRAVGLISRSTMLVFLQSAFSVQQWAEFRQLVRERVHST